MDNSFFYVIARTESTSCNHWLDNEIYSRIIARKRHGHEILSTWSRYVFIPQPVKLGSAYTYAHTDNSRHILGWQVNTTDAARLHVIALLDSHIQSERIFAFASSYRWAEVISILQKLRPSNKDLPDAPENELADLCDVVLAKKAENMLSSFFGQDKWIGLEQSLKDGIDSMGY